MNASVIMQKCAKQHKAFGIRVQQMSDGDWWRTWAFPMKESSAVNEGFDQNNVVGNMYETDEYPGCPYCGSHNFVQCNNCNKLSCWNNETALTCEWCGNRMSNFVIAKDKFDITGGDY